MELKKVLIDTSKENMAKIADFVEWHIYKSDREEE